ncbi:hypothetical protein V2I71_09535 [Peribacillus frigoritolerans]|uniref:hypothetical protein n=1 Tax=Peribacillus frigoritolerans TaxID=450367 RepID=UPI002ED30439|nr:hypothetical protein V2I71_09535 [Peribacillus frigoritolerans]
MNPIIKDCMLTDEQRKLIIQGIKQGKEEFQTINFSLPDTVTKKHKPFLQSDLVNTHVTKAIENNPHTQLKIYYKKAGFHPYIVIHDSIRNIFILLSKLPKNKSILNPSGYRGEFASGNLTRLAEMGISKNELYGDEIPYQDSLNLGIDNQPFGIIVCYDGSSDIVFEGALRPEQDDWIYKVDITNYINMDNNRLIPLNSYNISDIELPLKTQEEIVVKLKKS